MLNVLVRVVSSTASVVALAIAVSSGFIHVNRAWSQCTGGKLSCTVGCCKTVGKSCTTTGTKCKGCGAHACVKSGTKKECMKV